MVLGISWEGWVSGCERSTVPRDIPSCHHLAYTPSQGHYGRCPPCLITVSEDVMFFSYTAAARGFVLQECKFLLEIRLRC